MSISVAAVDEFVEETKPEQPSQPANPEQGKCQVKQLKVMHDVSILITLIFLKTPTITSPMSWKQKKEGKLVHYHSSKYLLKIQVTKIPVCNLELDSCGSLCPTETAERK